MKEVANTDAYKFSRLMYIIEAALEYFTGIIITRIKSIIRK